uniref:Calreticulin n=1 Tax=Rhizophora mucronata TaxID=61149 RepID=A0A2P2LPS8_RHIMU
MTELVSLTRNFFLDQVICFIVVKNGMNFLGAVTTNIWPKHDTVSSITAKFLLVNFTTEQLHVATTTVKLLFMLNRELEN